MNERIRELADQILPNEREFNKGDPKDWGYFFSGEELEKFAELIVRECLKEIKDMIIDESEQLYPNNKKTTECVNDRLLDAHDNILEHFGVAE